MPNNSESEYTYNYMFLLILCNSKDGSDSGMGNNFPLKKEDRKISQSGSIGIFFI